MDIHLSGRKQWYYYYFTIKQRSNKPRLKDINAFVYRMHAQLIYNSFYYKDQQINKSHSKCVRYRQKHPAYFVPVRHKPFSHNDFHFCSFNGRQSSVRRAVTRQIQTVIFSTCIFPNSYQRYVQHTAGIIIYCLTSTNKIIK